MALSKKGYIVVDTLHARGIRLVGCKVQIRYDDTDEGRRLRDALELIDEHAALLGAKE